MAALPPPPRLRRSNAMCPSTDALLIDRYVRTGRIDRIEDKTTVDDKGNVFLTDFTIANGYDCYIHQYFTEDMTDAQHTRLQKIHSRLNAFNFGRKRTTKKKKSVKKSIKKSVKKSIRKTKKRKSVTKKKSRRKGMTKKST